MTRGLKTEERKISCVTDYLTKNKSCSKSSVNPFNILLNPKGVHLKTFVKEIDRRSH